MLMRPSLSSLIKRIARGIPITSPWAAAFWWRPLAPPGRASLRHTWFTVQKKAGSLRGLCLYCRDGEPGVRPLEEGHWFSSIPGLLLPTDDMLRKSFKQANPKRSR